MAGKDRFRIVGKNMSTKDSNLVDRVLSLDKRIIYTLLLILLVAPLLVAFNLPVPVTDMTRGAYNAVDALKPGDRVLCMFGLQPADLPEMGPQDQVILQHVLNKGAKAVIVDFMYTTGGTLQDTAIIPNLKGVKYGVNLVNIGWVPGIETAIARFQSDIWGVTTLDFYGHRFQDLPLMNEVHKVSDFQLIAFTGQPGWTLGILIVPSHLPAIRGTWAVTVPDDIAYWKAGIYKGILAGSRGAAEYGNLIGVHTRANSMMDAISTSSVFIILLVILGNIGYVMQRRRKEVKK